MFPSASPVFFARRDSGWLELWSSSSGSGEQQEGLRRSRGQQLPLQIPSAASDRSGSVVRTDRVLESRGAEGVLELSTAWGAAFTPPFAALPTSAREFHIPLLLRIRGK